MIEFILGTLFGLAIATRKAHYWRGEYYKMTKYVRMDRENKEADSRDIKIFKNLCESGDTFSYMGAHLVVMPVETLYTQEPVN